MSVLRSWIDAGLITLIDWPKSPGQLPAYNDCLDKRWREARWIAFIDIDEFLFVPSGSNIPSVLANYADLAAIFVYWRLFGSSGHQKRPPGPVIEAYTKRLDDKMANDDPEQPKGVSARGKQGKSIVNPRLVLEAGVHTPIKVCRGAAVLDENRNLPPRLGPNATVSCEILRLNHYWSKSIEDLEEKISRGRATDNIPIDAVRMLQREKQLNECEDQVILPIWTKIKSKGYSSY